MKYQEFWFRFSGACRRRRRKRGPFAFLGKSLFASYREPKRWHRSAAWPSELPDQFIRLYSWEAEYLFTVASYARQGIVETGRRRGGSCFLMSCANPNVPIYSIDIAPSDDDALQKIFAEKDVGANVNLIVGDSQKTKYPQIKAFDLLYIDADHSYEGCTNDLENFYDALAPGGHILLHDCYLGNEVQHAVINFMIRHPECRPLLSPFIPASGEWTMVHGSMMHLQKPH